jgi:hypothetical protein
LSNRRPLETIRGAFKSGQRAENDRVHHCVILITQFRNPYAPDLLAAYGLWGSRMRQSAHMDNQCFICGIDRFTFDTKGKGFDAHIAHDHNMWGYLQLLVHLREKDENDFNGWES